MTADLDRAIRAVREAIDRSPVSLDDCAEMFAKVALRSLTEPSAEAIIMLNPAIADAELDDATIRVCMGRARRMDMGGIRVLNLFAYRTTYPVEFDTVADPVGPLNNHYIERYLGMRSFADLGPEPMIAAWGDGGLRKGHYRERWREVVSIICGDMGDALHHIGLTKAGQPKHPLRISYDAPLTLWMDRNRWRDHAPQVTADAP